MTTQRLEAFSDGVLAIVITIMVLEMKAPEGADFSALRPLLPKLLSYVFSFVYVGIYWNNHHHLFQVIRRISGGVLWANLLLLFWISLLPFATAWMGENHFAGHTATFYGLVLLMCSIAFMLIEKAAVANEGKTSPVGRAVRSHTKEYISTGGYLVGIVLSFFFPTVSIVLFYAVALIWLIPDRRFEKTAQQENPNPENAPHPQEGH